MVGISNNDPTTKMLETVHTKGQQISKQNCRAELPPKVWPEYISGFGVLMVGISNADPTKKMLETVDNSYCLKN